MKQLPKLGSAKPKINETPTKFNTIVLYKIKIAFQNVLLSRKQLH